MTLIERQPQLTTKANQVTLRFRATTPPVFRATAPFAITARQHASLQTEPCGYRLSADSLSALRIGRQFALAGARFIDAPCPGFIGSKPVGGTMTGGDPSVGTVRPERLALRTGGRIVLLSHDRIAWIAARNMRCELHLLDGSMTVNRLLKELRADLPAGEFLRINRSEVINRSFVMEFRPKSHGDGIVVLRDGTELVVSRRRRREVLDVLTQGGIGR